MIRQLALACAVWLCTCTLAADDYKPGPDSTTQPNVPHGEVLKFQFDHSKIFPGTTRDCWSTSPRNTNPKNPRVSASARMASAFMRRRSSTTSSPGTKCRSPSACSSRPAYVKSPDSKSRARSLQPQLRIRRPRRLTTRDSCSMNCCPKSRPNRHPTAGRSSSRTTATTAPSAAPAAGRSAAFTAAWERPDAFTRVFSSIGTYVGLRGGDALSQRSSANTNPNPSASFSRMAPPTTTTTAATGGWPTR